MKLIESELFKPSNILAIGVMATITHTIFKSFYNKLGKSNG